MSHDRNDALNLDATKGGAAVEDWEMFLKRRNVIAKEIQGAVAENPLQRSGLKKCEQLIRLYKEHQFEMPTYLELLSWEGFVLATMQKKDKLQRWTLLAFVFAFKFTSEML